MPFELDSPFWRVSVVVDNAGAGCMFNTKERVLCTGVSFRQACMNPRKVPGMLGCQPKPARRTADESQERRGRASAAEAGVQTV